MLGIMTFPRISSIVFDLSNNYTIEPPLVDSVWIVNTEQKPCHINKLNISISFPLFILIINFL